MGDLTLVIMAAGMGSRYGGLKQIEPIGPSGEFIIDYSIYDAKKAGFNKVVFIIKEENYDLFRKTIGKRIENKIEVEYAFQKMEDIPEGHTVPKGRTKPWGTSQAILSTKNKVKGDFAIINSDDFYGKEAYEVIAEFFKNKVEEKYLVVGYNVSKTLTEHGATKRGVCKVKNGCLEDLIESEVERKEGRIIATPLDGSESFEIEKDSCVAMNMFGFTDDIYEYIEKDFRRFFERNKENLTKCERLIPEIVGEMARNNYMKIEVEPTVARWQGITYKEDKDKLMKEIKALIEKGEYPEKL